MIRSLSEGGCGSRVTPGRPYSPGEESHLVGGG